MGVFCKSITGVALDRMYFAMGRDVGISLAEISYQPDTVCFTYAYAYAYAYALWFLS